MGSLHWQELVIILVIALVIFGPKRLPEVGSSLGRGVREFKDNLNGVTRGLKQDAPLVAAGDGSGTTDPVAQTVAVDSTPASTDSAR